MELSKKTTILFPPDLHDQLVQLARQLGLSLGELVRRACQAQYGVAPLDDRLAAADEIAAMSLPVGDLEQMERESMPRPEELLPWPSTTKRRRFAVTIATSTRSVS